MKKRMTVTALTLLCSGAALAEPPAGWHLTGSAPASYDAGTERAPDANKGWQAYIRAKADVTGFGTLMQTIDATAYRGKRLRLSAQMSTKDANRAQLWMRIDGTAAKPLAFDNMEQHPLTGTAAWTPVQVVLDVPEAATAIAYGFLLDGKGEADVRQMSLTEVARDVPVTGRTPLPSAPVNLGFEP